MSESTRAPRVPSTVDVLGLTYEVRVVDRVSREESLDGQMSPTEQVISIDRGMTPERLEQTFLHELVHAILDQLGYDEQNGDERLVQGLAIGMHQALFGPTSPS